MAAVAFVIVFFAAVLAPAAVCLLLNWLHRPAGQSAHAFWCGDDE